MPCAFCLKEKKRTQAVICHTCGKGHQFCAGCAKKEKLSALHCLKENGKAPRHAVKQFAAKAKESNARDKKLKETVKKCRAKKKVYTPPVDAVIDNTAFGPSDPADIRNDPLKYVHIRANEIWKSNPKLFNQTTAAVTIIECGNGDAATRQVLLTSCVEGPNPIAELARQAKEGEVLVPPDPIAHRVRHNLKLDEKKKGTKKTPDTVFIARLASSNPAVAMDVSDHPDYASAQRSMSNRNPKYTVTSLYPNEADLNETHAERRANRVAEAQGCRVIAQAPTIGVCDLCRASLGADGLAKVPAVRQSSAAYNDYRTKTLNPTLNQ
jgi:hypothetical protein